MSHFTLEETKRILEKIDDIQRIASENYEDNSTLMATIDHLARVAGMFADIKIQELEGEVKTSNPQVYIQNKLDIAYSKMRKYENDKSYYGF
ncbi:hypothetical protein J2S74_000991 [Evansella vedderi]|uniref:Uncharacterized protein n=1 Tax=Evansella vedderi TaxID=38282 RepID=A0ABT9ZQU5_9BACI|nr:hypothetical protein [Evansella vedderi]MDQ0253619.1 hypothetical protein [Evansella vedderi]